MEHLLALALVLVAVDDADAWFGFGLGLNLELGFGFGCGFGSPIMRMSCMPSWSHMRLVEVKMTTREPASRVPKIWLRTWPGSGCG